MRNRGVHTGARLDPEPLPHLATPLLEGIAADEACVDARLFDIASQHQPDCIERNGPKGMTNMNTKFSFHKAQSGGKPLSIDRAAQHSTSGRMSVLQTVVIITILVGFAVLHVVGFVLIASDRPMVGPSYMYPAD